MEKTKAAKPDPSTYILGVDGGSTKTIAVIADLQGHVRGAARGGGSNWTGEDVTIPMTVVIETVRQACKMARIRPDQIAAGVFTLAGADWPEDHTRRQEFLEKAAIARRVIVKNDSFGGLRAGTSHPYGMVIAAGTGCNAATITPDGEEWAFGYYETFGGAGTIARDAVVAVLRAEDGRGHPTTLTEMVLKQLDFPTVEAMLRAHIANQIDYSHYLALCPLVFEAAEGGDGVAAEIIVRQGEGLAEYAAAMIRRFKMEPLEFDLVLAGSVFKGKGNLLIDTITQEIQRLAPKANVQRARFEPVVGSVLLACDALGIVTTEELIQNLANSLPGDDFFDTTSGQGIPTQLGRANETRSRMS